MKQRIQEITELLGDKLFLPEDMSSSSIRLYVGEIPDYEDYLVKKQAVIAKRKKDNPPTWLLPCYEEPLLTREQECHLFRKYNVLKALTRFLIGKNSHIRHVERRWSQTSDVQQQIAMANYRLLVNYARKKYPPKLHEEIVSESYFKSMRRAVECFDWRKGNKFSTYLSWALFNNNSRYVSDELKHQSRFIPSETAGMFDEASSSDLGFGDELRHDRAKKLVAQLLPHAGTNGSLNRQIYILIHRFGLGRRESKTLQQIGDDLGVSKERVRQLETRALDELRDYVAQNGVAMEIDV